MLGRDTLLPSVWRKLVDVVLWVAGILAVPPRVFVCSLIGRQAALGPIVSISIDSAIHVNSPFGLFQRPFRVLGVAMRHAKTMPLWDD